MPNVLKEVVVEFEIDYLEYGEEWENDPEQYVEDMFGHREEFMEVLDDTDYEEMVALWDDGTLWDVIVYGTDLAFNKVQRKAIGQAAKNEYDARHPAVVPSFNGMDDEGYPIV